MFEFIVIRIISMFFSLWQVNENKQLGLNVTLKKK